MRRSQYLTDMPYRPILVYSNYIRGCYNGNGHGGRGNVDWGDEEGEVGY